MIQKLIQATTEEGFVIPKADPLAGRSVEGGASNLDLSGLFAFFTSAAFLGFLSWLWNFYTILAYLISFLFLALYVYATVWRNYYMELNEQEIRDMERLYDEQIRGVSKHSQLGDVLAHASSDNPNDWRLAIIEADIILDNALTERGYAGNTLGERLKSISPQQLSTLNDAWEAHKVRNRIAHEGADFVLTQRIAQETITRYQRVFAELGIT